MSTKAGKLPLSKKPKVGPVFDELNFDASDLHVPKGLLRVFEEHGFAHRFISSTKLATKGGFHKKGWKVFNIKDFNQPGQPDIIKGNPYDLGINPDGTFNKIEMVLAIRPKSMSDAHRAHIDAKTNRQSGNYNKRAAAEMKKIGQRAGIDVKIDEGFED